MTPPLLYALAGAVLFVLGLHALFTRTHLLRKVLAANVAGSGVFLVFVALAWRGEEAAPDPIPHAMVLTGIVVAVSATGLALALAVKMRALTGRARFGGEEPEGKRP